MTKTQASSAEKAPRLVFALGGEIVTTVAEAKRVYARAVRLNQEWLIPQCESVIRQLRARAA